MEGKEKDAKKLADSVVKKLNLFIWFPYHFPFPWEIPPQSMVQAQPK